jgi:hypothetical protein
MSAILGVETDLLYLSDQEIVWIVEQWRRMHPQEVEEDNDLGIDYFDPARIERMKEELARRSEVIGEIAKQITGEKLAEIQVIFYLDRDRVFTEYYEQRVEEAKKRHAPEKDPKRAIAHLMYKTNFLSCVRSSVMKLGRLSLAGRLATL